MRENDVMPKANAEAVTSTATKITVQRPILWPTETMVTIGCTAHAFSIAKMATGSEMKKIFTSSPTATIQKTNQSATTLIGVLTSLTAVTLSITTGAQEGTPVRITPTTRTIITTTTTFTPTNTSTSTNMATKNINTNIAMEATVKRLGLEVRMVRITKILPLFVNDVTTPMMLTLIMMMAQSLITMLTMLIDLILMKVSIWDMTTKKRSKPLKNDGEVTVMKKLVKFSALGPRSRDVF